MPTSVWWLAFFTKLSNVSRMDYQIALIFEVPALVLSLTDFQDKILCVTNLLYVDDIWQDVVLSRCLGIMFHNQFLLISPRTSLLCFNTEI